MKNFLTIVIISITFCSNFIPSNYKEINYTQVFFSWPQITNSDSYILILSEDENFIQADTSFVSSNSILYPDFLDWGTRYFWKVCSQTNIEECLSSNEFFINSLPEYHADQITINIINEQEYASGINILDFESIGYSLAVDKYGEPVWYTKKENFNMEQITVTQFLENGNFVGFSKGRGYEFNIDSDIVFEVPNEYSIHHEIRKTDNDTYFFIDAEIEYHPCPIECDDQFSDFPVPWQGDRFVEINSLGEIVWDWNTFDEISLNEYNPLYAQIYNGVTELDWTHSNSVFYDDNTESVYVSIRNLSRITSIDYMSKQVNWNIGEEDFMENPIFLDEINFSQQHSVQLTESGNLIFFDNARYQDPEFSRCVEVSVDDSGPILIWEHVLPDSMFTGSRGECDRLSNGNSLITAGRTGNVLEVNSNNDVTWHLNVKNNGYNVTIYRTERVPNLHPNTFSYIIDDLTGDNENYIKFNNGYINGRIYNSGWGIEGFAYKLLDEFGQEVTSGNISIDSEVVDYQIDLSELNIIDNMFYTLSINPLNNILNSKDFIFYLQEFIFGDINNDSEVDIIDIIDLNNLILTGNDFLWINDINYDLNVDILDIIILLNIILDDNN